MNDEIPVVMTAEDVSLGLFDELVRRCDYEKRVVALAAWRDVLALDREDRLIGDFALFREALRLFVYKLERLLETHPMDPATTATVALIVRYLKEPRA